MGWDAPLHLPRGLQLDGPSTAVGMKQQAMILRENEWLTLENSLASIRLCAASLGMHLWCVVFFFLITPWKMFFCPNQMGLQQHSNINSTSVLGVP